MSSYLRDADALWPLLEPKVRRIVAAAGLAGAGAGGGGVAEHDLSGTAHKGQMRDDQGPQFLMLNGSRQLTGNLAVAADVTIDGVDLSAHVAAPDAHHARVSAGTAIAVGGVSGQQVSVANGSAQYQVLVTGASPFAPGYTLLSALAGAGVGFTGGQFVVNAGAMISTAGDAVGLANGSAQWQIPVTQETPFTPAYMALSAFAGPGLVWSTNQFAVGAGAGITVSADAVALTTPGTLTVATTNSASGSHTHAVTASAAPGAASALLKTDDTGLLTLAALNLGTAMYFSSSGNTATAPDIQFTGSAIIAAEGHLYIALDSANAFTNRALIVGHDSPTTTGFAALFAFDEAGTATITGKVQVPLLDTATGMDMTIAPAGDLYLSPTGSDVVVAQTASLRSDNFLKTILTAGFRIGPTGVTGQTGVQAGSAEFDELRVRVFVADETRVDRGQWYLTKSYGILSRPFTVPNDVGDTEFLYVENSPHVAGALFSNNDWIMLVHLSIDTGIVLTKIWGQVSSCNTTGLTGEQRWTFTKRTSGLAGTVFGKGAIALDFGASGQGYILMDAVTATAPNIQVGRWVTNPYTPANYSVLTQMGLLDAVGFTGEYGLSASVSGYGVDAPWIKVSTAGAQLNNLPLLWTSGGVTKGYIGAWNDIWFGPSSADKRLYWNGTVAGIVGTVVANAGQIANWNIGVVDTNTISSTSGYMKLVNGGAGVARLEVGAGTAGTGAGIIARTGAATIVFFAGDRYEDLDGQTPFRVTLGGDLYATNATIIGNVTATSGYIGSDTAGWTINSESIYNAYVRLLSGGPSSAYSRIEVGDYANASTGLIGVIGLRGADGLATSLGMWAGRNYANRNAAPFRVTLGGDLYAASANITGAVTATSGAVGGWAISSGLISSTGIKLYSGAATVARLELGDGTDGHTTGIKDGDDGTSSPSIWAGKSWANRYTAQFRVYPNGDMYATSANITGAVTATSGAVGGWVVASGQITSDNIGMYSGAANTARLQVGSGSYMAGLNSAPTEFDIAMWAGTTHAGRVGAPFKVTAGGVLIASGAVISGTITINTGYVSGTLNAASAVQLGTDGQRMVLPNVTSMSVPTSSSAIRWFPSLSTSHTDAGNYTGLVGYRHTGLSAVDMLHTVFVGSDDAANYDARLILQAGHYTGGAYSDTLLVITREKGAGAKTINAICDTFSASNNVYVTGNMSAASITDRTPHFDGDGLAALRGVRGKRGEIDHASLPAFARRQVRAADGTLEEGRDLGAMISILVAAVGQLESRLAAMEGRRN